MKPKTEEFLNLLLWTANLAARPTFRNLTSSYEEWAYRNGLDRQTEILEKQRWIERDSKAAERVYRLTERGRLHVLGGRDPEVQWTRKWDGRWRMVLFDIPRRRNVARVKLRRYLVDRGFGCLQHSVWVTPDPLRSEREILRDGKVNAASLLLLDARPCAGESDAEIVEASWNFEAINERYLQCRRVLSELPKKQISGSGDAEALRAWADEERGAWRTAAQSDPMLPECLLPKGYLGRKVWAQRVRVLKKAARLIQNFAP